MTLRKFVPAALLLLAACTSSTTTATETQSVGLNPAGTKSCCQKSSECTAEQKAACEKSKGECTAEKTADATKP